MIDTPDKSSTERGVAARWTPKLGAKFCAVSSYFLANYHRLHAPHEKPVHLTEVMVIIHLMDHKWDARAPFPTVGRLARYMGLSERRVRDATRSLESRGLLVREQMSHGGPNRYLMQKLFDRLEELMDADAVAAAAATSSDEVTEVAEVAA